MLKKFLAAASATMMAAGPCLAAELPRLADDPGARRTGGVVGAYYKVPLGGGAKAKGPRAGLRLSMVHDYRNAGAPTARVVQSEGFELRLLGDKKPTLYLGGQAMTGEEAKKQRQNFATASTVVTLAVVVAVAVGGYYIYRAIDDSGEE
jgi:hypothetical protein